MFVRLIYASTSAQPINAKIIKDILTVAERNNRRDNITGVLCHGREAFMQILEGDAVKVNSVFFAIQRDIRHHDVQLLSYASVVDRLFSDWSMADVQQADPEIKRTIFDITGVSDFDLRELKSEQAIELGRRLNKVVPSISSAHRKILL